VISLLVVFTAVVSSIRRGQDLDHYLLAFVLYALASGVFIAYQQHSGTGGVEDALGHRTGGLGVNPNEGALYIGVGFCILLGFHLNRGKSPAWSGNFWVRLVVLAAMAIGLLGTASRSGILAAVFASGTTFLLVSFKNVRRSVGITQILFLLVFLATLAYFVPRLTVDASNRMAAVSEDGGGDRLRIWKGVWPNFFNRPLIGYGLVGSGTLVRSIRLEKAIRSVHSTPLALLLDGGVIGIGFCLLVIWRLAVVLKRILRTSNPHLRARACCLAGALCMSGLAMLVNDYYLTKLVWVLLGCVEGAYALGIKSKPPPLQPALGKHDPDAGSTERQRDYGSARFLLLRR
jgi:hypothetical protein